MSEVSAQAGCRALKARPAAIANKRFRPSRVILEVYLKLDTIVVLVMTAIALGSVVWLEIKTRRAARAATQEYGAERSATGERETGGSPEKKQRA